MKNKKMKTTPLKSSSAPKKRSRRKKETIARQKTEAFFKSAPDCNFNPALDDRTTEGREERGMIMNNKHPLKITPANGWDPTEREACERYFDAFDPHALYLPNPAKAHLWAEEFAGVPQFWAYLAVLRSWVLDQPVDLLFDEVRRTNPSLMSVISTAEKKKWKARAKYRRSQGDSDADDDVDVLQAARAGDDPRCISAFDLMLAKVKSGPAATFHCVLSKQAEGTDTATTRTPSASAP